MTDAPDPARGVLGEPPAPPPDVWTVVLARALDPQAPPIDAMGLLPDPAECATQEELTDDETDPADDDTDGWSDPPGQLTEIAPADHDDVHGLSPPAAPWSPGPEPEM